MPPAKHIPGYGLACEIVANSYPAYTKAYHDYSLATIFVCQITPWVQFGYVFRMPSYARWDMFGRRYSLAGTLLNHLA